MYAVLNSCAVNIDPESQIIQYTHPRLLNLGHFGKCERTGLYTLCKYLKSYLFNL